jgi:D-beta-D-heptose 7-phosphate kinase/D-beta-D-heptose 1-phosphate adenosyltransferase
MPNNQVTELTNLKEEFGRLLKSGTIVKLLGEKIILDYDLLVGIVEAYRKLGFLIIMTIGSYDMIHVGHLRYITKAKMQRLKNPNQKAILIVGMDSDSAVKRYKGEARPIINAAERLETLAYQNAVDFVTIIDDIDKEGSWYYGLLRMISPDVFVAVQNSYPEEQQAEIRAFCKKLVVLPQQAQNTSSTMIIQKVIKANPEILKRLFEGRKK